MKEATKNARTFFLCLVLCLLLVAINSDVFSQQAIGVSAS
jgi:hypothetical protein